MTPDGPLSAPPRNLRRSRRQAVESVVTGQLVPSGGPIKICDFSTGGFAMETRSPVRVGEVLTFRFTSKDGVSFLLRASVAHSRRISGPADPALYLSGLEFAAQRTLTGQQAIKTLLDKINRVLAFPRSVPA
jgi:hypothetical protein